MCESPRTIAPEVDPQRPTLSTARPTFRRNEKLRGVRLGRPFRAELAERGGRNALPPTTRPGGLGSSKWVDLRSEGSRGGEAVRVGRAFPSGACGAREGQISPCPAGAALLGALGRGGRQGRSGISSGACGARRARRPPHPSAYLPNDASPPWQPPLRASDPPAAPSARRTACAWPTAPGWRNGPHRARRTARTTMPPGPGPAHRHRQPL